MLEVGASVKIKKKLREIPEYDKNGDMITPTITENMLMSQGKRVTITQIRPWKGKYIYKTSYDKNDWYDIRHFNMEFKEIFSKLTWEGNDAGNRR